MELKDAPAAPAVDPATVADQSADWDARTADYDRQWTRFRERRSAAFPRTRAAIFDALQAASIAHVTIEFEGSGDSGQMEHATAYTTADEPISISDTLVAITQVSFDEGKDSRAEVNLSDAIETVAYELLDRRTAAGKTVMGGRHLHVRRHRTNDHARFR